MTEQTRKVPDMDPRVVACVEAAADSFMDTFDTEKGVDPLKPKADALAKKAMRTELENREHICALIQKAIEDDNLHAANWLRGHLNKQESDNG